MGYLMASIIILRIINCHFSCYLRNYVLQKNILCIKYIHNLHLKIIILTVSMVLSGAIGFVDTATAQQVKPIKISGVTYQANVPDTLDLADRAKLAINGL